jgi:hypothetical protein
MSVARGFGFNGRALYSNYFKPIYINANFIVDHTNGNGLGIRSLKANGVIQSVFMNTSATPGKVGQVTNPNPVAGYALVTFKNNFNLYLGGFTGQIVPLTSTSTTSLTAGHAYVITSLGTTTLVEWQTAGVPNGFVPAVGTSFISLVTASIGGTGTVGLPGVEIAPRVTVVGDPNQSLANANIAQNAGAQILLQFAGPTNSSTTTLVATAPADGTVIGLQFQFEGSSVTIPG